MEKFVIKAKKRTGLGNSNNALRRSGFIPGVLYGRKIGNTNLLLELSEFGKVYRKAGETTLIDLEIDGGAAQKVLVQSLQIDPITSKVIHVDFHGIDMSEKLEADIPLKFIGESSAVKELGGILVKTLDAIKVRCLPADLVHEIEVDISPLAALGSHLRIKDIKLPHGLEALQGGEETVLTVTEPRSDAELAALTEKPEMNVDDVKVVEKEKKTEEGEEAVPAAAKAPVAKTPGK